jgi:hypothetical protein
MESGLMSRIQNDGKLVSQNRWPSEIPKGILTVGIKK